MKQEFIDTLIELASEGTGCSIQYGGCPCNTCFHDWGNNELGLDPRLTHALWLIALSLRGDSTKAEMQEAIDLL
jgi:hypothetical protein